MDSRNPDLPRCWLTSPSVSAALGRRGQQPHAQAFPTASFCPGVERRRLVGLRPAGKVPNGKEDGEDEAKRVCDLRRSHWFVRASIALPARTRPPLAALMKAKSATQTLSTCQVQLEERWARLAPEVLAPARCHAH